VQLEKISSFDEKSRRIIQATLAGVTRQKNAVRGSNPPVPLVSLLDRHYSQDGSIITLVLNEQGIPARDMKTKTVVIQLFKITPWRPVPLETGDMLTNNTAILFCEKFNKFLYIGLYIQHFLKSKFFRCLTPGNRRFGSRHIKIVHKAFSLLGRYQRLHHVIKCLTRFPEI
jgi:hypothetical protein